MNSVVRLLLIAPISVATLSTVHAQIRVTKQVACYSGGNQCGAFGTNSYGVSTTSENPAFCYSITVSNANPVVALTNVSVIDDKFGDLTAEFSCIAPVFQPGASCTFIFTETIAPGANNTLNAVTNTVTASGQSVADGQSTTASDQAIAVVVPASVSCVKYYTLDGGFLTNNAVIGDHNPHTVVWYVVIANTGLANLEHVNVADPDTGCTLPNFSNFRLDAGASITFALCTNAAFICDNGFTNTVTANATSLPTGQTPFLSATSRGTTPSE